VIPSSGPDLLELSSHRNDRYGQNVNDPAIWGSAAQSARREATGRKTPVSERRDPLGPGQSARLP
jgi:hypothetical protein